MQKSNWFSLIPVSLRHDTVPNFGVKSSATISRTGDYALKTWFKVSIPKIMLTPDPAIFAGATVRWTRFLGHNLINKLTLTHNELVTQEFTSEWLDFNYHFNIDVGKRMGYRIMVGDIPEYTNAQPVGMPVGNNDVLSLPLPLWFAEDSGRALPIAALPYCETKINYDFRNWTELVVVYPGVSGVSGTRIATVNDVCIYGQPTVKPYMVTPETYALYAMVHNDEREMMGQGNRDILMHQIQMTQSAQLKGVDANQLQSFDIRFSNPIVALFFAVKNVSINTTSSASGAEHSNYTTENNYTGAEPLKSAQLLYENNIRLDMETYYFRHMVPFNSFDEGKGAAEMNGVYVMNYALDPFAKNPCGSTNYNKLTNVSLQFKMSDEARNAAAAAPINKNGLPIQWPDQTGTLAPMPQTGQSIIIGKNHQLGRVGSGTFGFPTL